MNVLILSHLYPNGQRALNCFVHRQVKALAKQGCDMQVLSPVPWAPWPFVRGEKRARLVAIPQADSVEGITAIYPRYPTVPRGGTLGLQSYGMAVGTWGDLRRACRTADVLHVHTVYPDGFAATLLSGILRLPVPVCVTAHGSDVRLHGSRSTTRYQVRRCVRSADAVITGHPEIAGLLKGMGRTDVVMIPNGVDLGEFSVPRGDAARAELGLPQSCRIVVFVGNLNPFKDPVTFVRSIPGIVESEERTLVLIVGDGPLRPTLQQLAVELGVEHSVRFLGYRRDVARILAVADVFVAASPVENIWSTTIVEAMTARIPCVVTNAGTTSRYLQHLETAYLVEPGNPASMADGVIDVLGDAALASHLRTRARSMVENSLSVDRSAKQLVLLYQRLLSEKREH